MGLSISISAVESLAAGIAASVTGGPKPFFEFCAGPFLGNQLIPMKIHGHEGISRLFRFEIYVASRVECDEFLQGLLEDAFGTIGKTAGGAVGQNVAGLLGQVASGLVGDAEPGAFETLLIGQPATLIIHSPFAPPRIVQGICTQLERLGPLGGETSDWQAYRITLEPRLALATMRRNTRVFQDSTLREIVNAILEEHAVPVTWTGGSQLPVRDYTAQYQETDYDFIRRLLAEAGFFFFFEPPHRLLESLLGGSMLGTVAEMASVLGGRLGQLADVAGFTERLIIADSAECYPPIASADGSEFFPSLTGKATSAAKVAGSAFARGAISGGIRLDSSGIHIKGDVNGTLRGGAEAAIGALARLAFPSPVVTFQELNGMIRDQDFVFQLSMERNLRPQQISLREFDYQHPARRLEAAAKADPSLPSRASGEYCGRRLLALNTHGNAPALVGSQELEIYDHHDEYFNTDIDVDHVRIHLEQHRRDCRVVEGQSVCARLVPGYRFQLENHPTRICNNVFAVTYVEHWGEVPEWKTDLPELSTTTNFDRPQTLTYRNRFEGVPATIAYRMPRPQRAVQQVAETAIVVGVGHGDIHTDEQGRIKARFHWDREGKNTCWLRVLQPMAGAGWGHQFIPRVGMEVLVTYLGGDPDKPVVTGCLPNAHHPLPFPLPAATRSGIRTLTTPGGQGYNELSFEDARGRESIDIHAQRDLCEVVQNDRHSTVKGVRSDLTERARLTEVREDSIEHIGGKMTLRVDGLQETAIRGASSLHVLGATTQTHDDGVQLNVKKLLATNVSGDERREVEGNQHLFVQDDVVLKTRGSLITVVGSAESERSHVTFAQGNLSMSSTRTLEISSDEEIVLRCGGTRLRLTPKGIELSSDEISAGGVNSRLVLNDGIGMKSAGGIRVIADQSLVFKSEKGSAIGLGSEAQVSGSKILLNSPLSATESLETAKAKPTRLTLVSNDGTPLAEQPYVVVTEEGRHLAGVTDADGNATLELQSDAQVYFTSLPNAKTR